MDSLPLTHNVTYWQKMVIQGHWCFTKRGLSPVIPPVVWMGFNALIIKSILKPFLSSAKNKCVKLLMSIFFSINLWTQSCFESYLNVVGYSVMFLCCMHKPGTDLNHRWNSVMLIILNNNWHNISMDLHTGLPPLYFILYI